MTGQYLHIYKARNKQVTILNFFYRWTKLNKKEMENHNEPVHCGCHEDQVRSEQRLDEGQRNGSCLVNNHQLCLAELGCVSWVDVLDCLSVVVKDVYSDDSLVELRVRRLADVVIFVLSVLESIKAWQQGKS